MSRLFGGLIVVFVLVVGPPPAAAQEPLWSATMTAERAVGTIHDTDEEVTLVGYVQDAFGRLSDRDFDFNGATYEIRALYQFAERVREVGEGGISIHVTPPLDHHALERMTLNVDGYMLHVSDNLLLHDLNIGDLFFTEVYWAEDPGFRWRDGQRVDVALAMAGQPVPALPLAAAGFLALLLALSAYRRGASRN